MGMVRNKTSINIKNATHSINFTFEHPDILLPCPKLQGQKTLTRQQTKMDRFQLFKTVIFLQWIVSICVKKVYGKQMFQIKLK